MAKNDLKEWAIFGAKYGLILSAIMVIFVTIFGGAITSLIAYAASQSGAQMPSLFAFSFFAALIAIPAGSLIVSLLIASVTNIILNAVMFAIISVTTYRYIKGFWGLIAGLFLITTITSFGLALLLFPFVLGYLVVMTWIVLKIFKMLKWKTPIN